MTASPHRAAVLGSPIGHSLSPVLHRAAYAVLGLDWSYRAVDVDEERLPGFLDSCDDTWAGLSLTMPLKTSVLPLLHERSRLVDVVGAANTVLFRHGRRIGENTDVPGMVRAIRELAPNAEPRTATILGGGATARSALAAVDLLGVETVYAGLRDPGRGAHLQAVGAALGCSVRLVSWEEASHHLDTDIVVSTVPGRAADGYAQALPEAPGTLLDVAYGDQAGELVAAWNSRGGRAADGLSLLLWQAADQVRLMTGREAPVEAMRSALMRAAREGPEGTTASRDDAEA